MFDLERQKDFTVLHPTFYEGKVFLHDGPFPGGFRKPKMERAGQDVSEHFVKYKRVLKKIILIPVVRLHSQQQVT